jgi:hypothetical protein
VLDPVRRRAILMAMVGVLGAACGSIVNSPPPTPKAPYTLAPPTPPISAVATVAPTEPGQPYVAEDLASYINAAPVGFPTALRTPAVAEALADRIWTFDGQPYRDLWLAGSCENGACEFSATGVPAFARSADVVDAYFLKVNLGSGLFSDGGRPSLKGLPSELVPRLDAIARAHDAAALLADEALLGATWEIPPPAGTFLLRYGRGLEEGDPAAFVTVSLPDEKVLSIRSE